MKLTREDLAMMLDEMNNNNADYINVDANIEPTWDGMTLNSITFNAIKLKNKRKFLVANLLTIKE